MWRILQGDPPEGLTDASVMDIPELEELEELLHVEAARTAAKTGRATPTIYQDGYVSPGGTYYVVLTLVFDDNTPEQEIWFRYGDAEATHGGRKNLAKPSTVLIGAVAIGAVVAGMLWLSGKVK